MDNNNDIDNSSIYLCIGNSIYNENIAEYIFLEKPKNLFLYFIFNLSSLDIYDDEFDYNIIKKTLDKNRNNNYKLKKFWKGLNNDKFIFIENKTLQIVLKDDNNESKMLIYPLEINYQDSNYLPDKTPFIIKILDKMYIIIDISKLFISQNTSRQRITLGIFEIYFDKERNLFTTKILQEVNVNIKSKDKNYNLARISPNTFYILDDNSLFFFILNNNCIVKSIYSFNKQKTVNQMINYYFNKYENFFRAYLIDQNKHLITCTIININEKINNYDKNENSEENISVTLNLSNNLNIQKMQEQSQVLMF